jgi:hypothetical protein
MLAPLIHVTASIGNYLAFIHKPVCSIRNCITRIWKTDYLHPALCSKPEFSLLPLVVSTFLLSACTTSVRERSYDEYHALAPADTFAPLKKEPRLKGIARLLSEFDSEVISTTLDEVYANPLYFNDTFHTFHSRDALKSYFLSLSAQSDTQVTFLDVQTVGNDALIRWSMTIRFSVWWKDIDVNSIGITHVRFNELGKITMHQDYWDGVEGFYAHLPIFGSLMKSIRSAPGEPGKITLESTHHDEHQQ